MPAGYRDHLARSRAPSPLAVGRYFIEPTGRTDSSASNMRCPTSLIWPDQSVALWHRQPRSIVLVKL